MNHDQTGKIEFKLFKPIEIIWEQSPNNLNVFIKKTLFSTQSFV